MTEVAVSPGSGHGPKGHSASPPKSSTAGSTAKPASMTAASPTSRKQRVDSPARNTVDPSPVSDNPAADLRNMRKIIAEDPDWSLATVPQLTELVLKQIVDNFENNSLILNDLLPKHKIKVLDRISTSLPLKVVAHLVDNEGYWKRRSKATWPLCDVATYGHNWKRMFFERNLQRIIEHTVPETTDVSELQEALLLSCNYIEKLDIRQLLPPVKDAPKALDSDELSEADGSDAGDGPEIDHFDFGTVIPALPNIKELHLTFGVKDCGMNFEWSLFQFTARDCLLLAKCIATCTTLQVLHLHRSKVDDDKIRVMISHILDHPGLVELDLSHNIIGDRGARAIGKILNNHSVLTKLNLCDNSIRGPGAQAIAHALTKNDKLQILNLRMNRLGDEGGQAICRALLKNTTLIELHLGSNDLTEPTAAILSQVVQQNKTVTKIDLTCNSLGPDGGKQIQEGMASNGTITHMDLRLTDCGQESEYCIQQILFHNRERARDPKSTCTTPISSVQAEHYMEFS